MFIDAILKKKSLLGINETRMKTKKNYFIQSSHIKNLTSNISTVGETSLNYKKIIKQMLINQVL